MQAILNNQKVKIRSPYAIRPWQHVLEPLTGYLILAQKLYTNGSDFAEAWNFGPNNQDEKTVQWMVEKLCNKWGNNASFEMDNKPQPHEANFLKLDCAKANTLLNWRPKWTVERTIEAIVEWYKAYECNDDMMQACYKQVEDYFKE